jgi:hypothetical protein
MVGLRWFLKWLESVPDRGAQALAKNPAPSSAARRWSTSHCFGSTHGEISTQRRKKRSRPSSIGRRPNKKKPGKAWPFCSLRFFA